MCGGCAEGQVNQCGGFPKVGRLAAVVFELLPDFLVGGGRIDKGRVLDQGSLAGTHRNIDVLPAAFAVQYPIAIHPALALVFDDIEDYAALDGGNQLEIADVGEK